MNPVFSKYCFFVDFQIWIHFYALTQREKETFRLGSFLVILLTTIHVTIYFRFKQLVRDARFTCKQSTARNFATVGSICSDLWKATQGLKYTALLMLIFSECYVKVELMTEELDTTPMNEFVDFDSLLVHLAELTFVSNPVALDCWIHALASLHYGIEFYWTLRCLPWS